MTIYASPTPTVQNNLWNHLTSMSNSIDGPWVLLGDFNKILHPFEVTGGTFSVSRSLLLAQVANDCGISDLDTQSGHSLLGGRTFKMKVISAKSWTRVWLILTGVSFSFFFVENIAKHIFIKNNRRLFDPF